MIGYFIKPQHRDDMVYCTAAFPVPAMVSLMVPLVIYWLRSWLVLPLSGTLGCSGY